VNDFEQLVKELEEKHRQLSEGIIKETPLLEFLIRQELEKNKKKNRSRKSTDGDKPPKSENQPVPTRDVPKKFKKLSLDSASIVQKDRVRTKKIDRRSRVESNENKNEKNLKSTNKRTDDQSSSASKNLTPPIKKEDTKSQTSNQSISKRQEERKSIRKSANEATSTESKTTESRNTKEKVRRNKDRPEMPIYRPLRARGVDRKTNDASGSQKVENGNQDCDRKESTDG